MMQASLKIKCGVKSVCMPSNLNWTFFRKKKAVRTNISDDGFAAVFGLASTERPGDTRLPPDAK